MATVEPDLAALVKNLGKGLAQVNLRLSRLLDRPAPAHSAGTGDDTLEPLLDLVDAVDEALARRPRRGFFGRRRDEDLWRGISLAAERVRDHLRGRGIEPIPTAGAFDDEHHRAIEAVKGSRENAGTLARTHRRGWLRKTGGEPQVIRTAHVSVWTHAHD